MGKRDIERRRGTLNRSPPPNLISPFFYMVRSRERRKKLNAFLSPLGKKFFLGGETLCVG